MEESGLSLLSPVKKLPTWLLEFDSFSIATERKSKTGERETDRSRPLTESSASKRPQWFEELIQQRRHSDEYAKIENDKNKTDTNNHTITITKTDTNTKTKTDTKTNTNTNTKTNITNGTDNYNKRDSLDITSIFSDSPAEPRKTSRSRRSSSLLRGNDINDENAGKSTISLPLTIERRIMEVIPNNPTSSTSVTSIRCKIEPNVVDQVDDCIDADYYDFIIPELPQGRELTIEIKSNWGDDDYVGLNGIEVFDSYSENLAQIDTIKCDFGSSENLKCLIDGIYRTHDDNHIWTSQLDKNKPLNLKFKFKNRVSIVLIRIWNYNKSRIYSYRGVRLINVKLDNTLIFSGEIAKASGELKGSPERFGDTILFTINEKILEAIANKDTSFQELMNNVA